MSYIFSQFCLTRCLILEPPTRPQAKLDRSETTSPWKLATSLRPRKFMTSVAPKHKVLRLSSRGYSSRRPSADLNITSVEYSACASTQ